MCFAMMFLLLCMPLAYAQRGVVAQLGTSAQTNADANVINLSGDWKVALDREDVGVKNEWWNKTFAAGITLPGTLCEAGYGDECTLQPAMTKEVFRNLKRKYDYVGVAWYKRTVFVPKNWKRKGDVVLTLERVLWDSQVWVNGVRADSHCESLIAPHRFHVGDLLRAGKDNEIVIRIDNRKRYDISMSDQGHAYTNETQTMWNGVLGRMTLEAHERVWIEDMRLTPDVDRKQVNVLLKIAHDGTSKVSGKLCLTVKSPSGEMLPERIVEWDGADSLVLDYPIDSPVLWDEFAPTIYEAVASLEVGKSVAYRKAEFGMRKLSHENAMLTLNGHRLFLRGTLECCIFPLTGYPPTDRQGWEKVFATARLYGLNHLRSHSWCPPKAAFEVADRMGFYLQVELPVWSLGIGKDKSTVDFLYAEAEAMIREYGNHPSFCFWSLGNELQGDFKVLDDLLLSLKAKDKRHLYCTTSFTFEKGHGDWPEVHDDFFITQWTKKGWVRGQGIFDDEPVCFNRDYSAAIEGMPVPIITHEIGQYSVYPNLKEIDKYTGNLVPLNFMAVADDLRRKGHSDWAEENLDVSGKLAVILYKEEIERALKTPGVSGFQLLDLHDFPGQSTALVGVLDAFWDSKGLVTPEEFRRFCGAVVPLVRFDRATYYNSDSLEVEFELANFGNKPLDEVRPVWRLSDSEGHTIAGGQLDARQNLPIGNALKLGDIAVPLSAVTDADRLTLTLGLDGTEYSNSWNVWVYPKEMPVEPASVVYTRSFDEAEAALKEGCRVLLNPALDELNGLEGKFVQVFWSPVHFPNQPGTMGIACNPAHPAFAAFPTEKHTNWQWWDICKRAKTMDVDSLQADMKPLIRMADNFYKNRNLALLFEAKVGEGSLMVCSTDLGESLATRPVARQLRHSLLEYMASDGFAPVMQLSFDRIRKVLHNVEKKALERKSIYE